MPIRKRKIEQHCIEVALCDAFLGFSEAADVRQCKGTGRRVSERGLDEAHVTGVVLDEQYLDGFAIHGITYATTHAVVGSLTTHSQKSSIFLTTSMN